MLQSKNFVKRVFTIHATNASFCDLLQICKFKEQQGKIGLLATQWKAEQVSNFKCGPFLCPKNSKEEINQYYRRPTVRLCVKSQGGLLSD